jgi:hypothetical protein
MRIRGGWCLGETLVSHGPFILGSPFPLLLSLVERKPLTGVFCIFYPLFRGPCSYYASAFVCGLHHSSIPPHTTIPLPSLYVPIIIILNPIRFSLYLPLCSTRFPYLYHSMACSSFDLHGRNVHLFHYPPLTTI